MKIPFDENLINFARSLSAPLYAVGGYVRNFLIGKTVSNDVDLCSSVNIEELSSKLKQFGFKIIAEYKRTKTLVFSDGKIKYEFTAMRKDSYTGGGHQPYKTEYTEDITEDALRRDFKCNAIYYDIAKDILVDPLNGAKDVEHKILSTVKTPEQVFCHDGLRLMRLARFAGELGFKPTEEVLVAMRKYADNITDIKPERVTEELKRILVCDEKYWFSDKQGHYTALKILDQTRVLDKIIPELTLGRGMKQRADFHKHDVLEHSLRSFLYVEKSVRLSALLHDIGKPFCFVKAGNFYGHNIAGESIARQVLLRLKFDKKTIDEVCFLVRVHMFDVDLKVKVNKVRLFLTENFSCLDKIFSVKQADFSASSESKAIAPTIIKWQKILNDMLNSGVPFSIRQLNITAKDLIEIGFKGVNLGKELKRLFKLCVENPEMNTKDKLIRCALKGLY